MKIKCVWCSAELNGLDIFQAVLDQHSVLVCGDCTRKLQSAGLTICGL